jgi:hypothetical protein
VNHRSYAHRRRFREDNPFGTSLSRKLMANRSEYTRRIAIPGAGQGTLTFVLAAQLLSVLQPALDQIVAAQKDDHTNNAAANGTMTLARMAASFGNRNAEAIVRRLFGLTSGSEKTTDLAIADSLCLAANNPYALQRLHLFPRHWRGAQEIVMAWAFAREVELGEAALEELAAETLEIARALWHRPERQVTCTREAFEAIGGEPSPWLTTGQ